MNWNLLDLWQIWADSCHYLSSRSIAHLSTGLTNGNTACDILLSTHFENIRPSIILCYLVTWLAPPPLAFGNKCLLSVISEMRRNCPHFSSKKAYCKNHPPIFLIIRVFYVDLRLLGLSIGYMAEKTSHFATHALKECQLGFSKQWRHSSGQCFNAALQSFNYNLPEDA